MSWRDLCVTSTPRGFADCAGFAEDSTAQQGDGDEGFADIADIALEKKKHTLSLKKDPPLYDFEANPHSHTPCFSTPGAKSAESAKPIQPGWLVTYRDRTGRLRGGADERSAGTVADCDRGNVTLANGVQLPLHRITAVARTNQSGAILAAWDVTRHGLDGQRKAGV